MPAQYTFVDTAYVELVGTIFSQTVENTLYIKNATFWTDVTLNQLAQAMEDWWVSSLKPYVTDGYTLTLIRCRNMGEVDSYVIEHSVGEAGGLSGTAPLPSSNTMTIKFGTGLAGRAKRGRNFFIGLTEAAVTGNTVAPATVANIVGAYQNLNSEIQSVSPAWRHVVASRAGLPTTGGEGDTYFVTNYSSDGQVKSQRRRLTGVGS